ncbi:MarR family winged helix-turn-helix transcriptional regulator [Diaphorobacter aerolatus]|uniref:MarR family transcriptional regulator n=1 Tax=Diaphorobacter aerolatus TaxID=1288495 RepID=A0A7H0GLG8_9BURK|nr:MarR family transcriptional regulator [Diaphorobacter aerolatus]QNP49134.1 MarR family transcriptional regulator [Diaphorobacter aerolatus]
MAYLTYQLELLKTAAIKAANPHYLKAVNLRVRELRVLRLLLESPGVTATELRRKLVLDKTLMSKNISYLEKRGLVQRMPNPNDSRLQLLSLTKEGERVCKKSNKIGESLEGQMFAQLTPNEWVQLRQLLDRAYDSFLAWEREVGTAA